MATTKKTPQPSYQIRVIGTEPARLRDAYHAFLRMPWYISFAVIVAGFLTANVLFGGAYALCGGVANARAGSLIDGFYFSVQTMATIGYGYMYPQSTVAHILVVVEAILGMLLTALCAGMAFAKFSQPQGRIAFSHEATVGLMDGVPTLMFRVGNMRGNQIVEATVRVTMIRTERTREGATFYRMIDIPLVRDRSPAMSRSWNILHEISPKSPLHGYDPERMAGEEVELLISLIGVDDTSYQPVHARHQYEHFSIVWGARYADILTETPDGNLLMDASKFHQIVRTEPTADFPYPRPAPAPDSVAAAAHAHDAVAVETRRAVS